MIRWFIKLIVTLFCLAAIGFGLLDVYFTHVRPIADQVRADAAAKEAAEHVHPLTYEEIPATFREALISTEDRRFSTDPGIDFVGVFRSLVVDIERDGYVEGGSTITQQLIDNTIIGQQKTLYRKVVQAADAIGLYDTMSKSETLAIYCNVIYFGSGAYGLYNAAETYFGLPPGELNDGELTMLAGLPNSPSRFDPFVNYAAARQRQQVVLDNMVDNGVITELQAQQIFAEPIHLK